jgi:predicted esterase
MPIAPPYSPSCSRRSDRLAHATGSFFATIALVKFLLALTALAAAVPAASTTEKPGLHTGVVLTESSPLASTAEIVRRTFSPLTGARIAATHSLAGQPIDIAHESFTVYVPEHKPLQGYALLVFVPPTEVAKVPPGWASVLDDKGVIFVSAEHSGNDAKVESRRLPLAVIAAEQLMHDYGVDPSRVLVGGFSGGSRVALRIALAYPDVFRGALLNSDSDPIGTTAIPLPPSDLMRRFQNSSRLYYVTGALDPGARNMQAASETSLQSWCVSDFHDTTMWHTGHATADERALSHALDVLLDPAPSRREGLAECRARLESEMASEVQRIEAFTASGDKTAAREALTAFDTKFGGLAADQVVRLKKNFQ